jgi:16S rRNA (cytosine1402-N4)-methyltransferase
LSKAPFHTPVLLEEVLSLLITAAEGTYVDATLGGGGHAETLLQHLGPSGRLIGLDADRDALSFAGERLKKFGDQSTLIRGNFAKLESVVSELGLTTVSGVLFDLGVSSFQLDEGSKGFSFRTDTRLDMRMNRGEERDAVAVLREFSAEQLTEMFFRYGEEKHARRIAKEIVQRRIQHPIVTSGELAALVENVVGSRFLTKSLARVFQAIRIEVNDELKNLESGLQQAIDVVVPGGRIVVISYHSLEDRIVKHQFKTASATSVRSGTVLLPDRPVKPRLRILTKKPVEASRMEQSENPRARSAKLRAAERV